MDYELEVEDRVRVESHSATIRYLGEVAGYGSQIWAGLEWDDPTRGKHDGVVKGTRYFKTVHPTSGSLVKVQNLIKPVGLLEEVRDRYVEEGIENHEISMNHSSKKIELIGMEKTAMKQSNIEKLVNIVLDNRLVGFAPPPGTPPFVFCRELNLYGNLLHRWHTVKYILKFFPRIQELNLRRNRMMKFENDYKLKKDEEENGVSVFSETCKKLVFSECTWDEQSVEPILQRFAFASEIVAFGNELRRFVVSSDRAQWIVLLDLEDNPLETIDSIQGTFPNLLHLSVANCKINSLQSFDGSKKFPKLEILNLRGNAINEWNSVNCLQSLPHLKKLFFDCKNLNSEKGIYVFEVIIAKLSLLEELNRFDVSEVERRSAEIRYLNKYVLIKDESLLKDHSEDLARLIKIHGEPTADNAKKGLTIVKIRIEYGNRIETRSLPLVMNVQKVRDMLARLFKIPSSSSIRLYLVMEQHRIELDNPLRELGHYSPSGDKDVLVVENDS